MAMKITVIPEGQVELRTLIRGAQTTTFDVYVKGERTGKVSVAANWKSPNIPTIDPWTLTTQLRAAELIGKESTIVVSMVSGIAFVEGGASTVSIDKSLEAKLDSIDVE